MDKILVTGTAGFIGFHLIKKLVKENFEIVGLDNINNYYDVRLKYGRLKESGITGNIEYNKFIKSSNYSNYRFIKLNLEDKENLKRLFQKEKFDYVINLAAQAGVRYSLENPQSYIESNIVGFMNILENSRYTNIKHLVYASSSSVYGLNKKQPFSTKDCVEHPISVYAATKKSNELLAHTYSYLFNLPTTGLRFFTVYGPWGRPDMALFLFVKAILNDKHINVFNFGNMSRDFTYIDDIVESVKRILKVIPERIENVHDKDFSPDSSNAPYKVYNIGNNSPVRLMDFIETIEKKLGKKAQINFLPLQPGDVPSTYANVDELVKVTGFIPETSINKGISNFIDWYKSFF